LATNLDKVIRAEVDYAVNELIVDPAFRFRVRGIRRVLKRTKDGSTLCPVTIVTIETNNRPLLLGQFLYFPENGIRGFHNDWLEAYLTGFLRARGFASKEQQIHIEAVPMKRTKQLDYSYHYLPLSTILDLGLMEKKAPLVKKMKEYELSWVLMEGSLIVGPDLGLIEGVEEWMKSHSVKSVVDLFAGTGALSKVAIMNGAEHATCVDVDLSRAKQTLGAMKTKASFLERNAFLYAPTTHVDLTIADPIIDFSLRFAQERAKFYAKKTSALMLTVSFIEDLYWHRRVLTELRKNFSSIHVRNTGRLIQAVCCEM